MQILKTLESRLRWVRILRDMERVLNILRESHSIRCLSRTDCRQGRQCSTPIFHVNAVVRQFLPLLLRVEQLNDLAMSRFNSGCKCNL